MRKTLLVVSILVLSVGLVYAVINPATTEAPLNVNTDKSEFTASPQNPSPQDFAWYPIAAPIDSPSRVAHATVYDPNEDKIYMIGGQRDGTAASRTNFCQQYDPVANIWTTKLPMPTARAWVKGAYVRGKIYVIGGIGAAAVTAVNEEYTTATNTWVAKAPRPTALGCDLEVAWRDSLIYCMGGWDGVATSGSVNVDIYNPFTNTWLAGTPLPMNADMGDAVIRGDTIYITNAVNRSASSCWTNLYKGAINPANPLVITWSAGPAFTTATSITGAAVLGTKIYWLGGFNGLATASNTLWQYDITTGLITTAVSYPYTIARCCFMTSRPSQNELYVIAGDANCDWNAPNNYYYKYKEYTNDVGVDVISSPGSSHLVNTLMIPSARIKNYGTATNSFTVRCSIINAGGTVRHVNQQSVTSLLGGDTVTKAFGSWTPTTAELLTVYVTTYLGTDQYPANDQMTKPCDVGNYIIIGTGTLSAYVAPIYRYWNQSASEMIYLQSEIGMSGNILNIAFNKASGTDVNPIDSVFIYMKHTTATTLAAGNWDTTGMTRVYGYGQYPNNATSGWMDVALTTPFNYNNTDNLQILVLKRFQAYISTYPYWYYTATPDIKTRYYYTDNQPLPTTMSYTTLNRPNLRLSISPPVPNDVGVDAILAPLATHAVNTSMTPSARIKNYGTATNSFTVRCSIINAGGQVRHVNSQSVTSLAGGDTVTKAFGSWTPTTAELLTVYVTTYLGTDVNPTNDQKTRTTDVFTNIDAAVTAITTPGGSTATKRLSFTPQVTVTNNGSYSADVPVIAEIWSGGVTEDFEATNGGLTADPATSAWEWGVPTYVSGPPAAHSGTKLWGTVLAGTYAINANWKLTTGTITSPSDNPELKFWHWYYIEGTPPTYCWDGGNVKISVNGGPWTVINPVGGYVGVAHTDNVGIPGESCYTTTTTGNFWSQAVFPLPVTTGQQFQIRWHFGSDPSVVYAGWYIDDVTIGPPPALAYRDSILVSVPSGTDASVPATFNLAFGPMTEGTYLFKSYTKLAGDLVPTNDMVTRAFTVNPLTLTLASPANGITTGDNTPSFSWNEVIAAESYRIEVDNNDDFSSPEFAGTLGDLEIESDPLLDSLYYWHVRVETPGTPDPYSAVRTLTIDTQGPVPPVLVLPEDEATLETATPTFTWEAVTDAVNYNLVVDDGTKAVVINIETSELTYTPTTPLDEGSFTWTVRAQDALGNWGDPSAPWSFSISLGTPGWASVESVPAALDLKAGKFVKDGGAICAGGGTKDGDDIYMFPGNKSWYFYKYTRGTPGTYTTLESIPYGFKPTDPTKYNKKKIGKGAALCFDNAHTIYATKGNGTTELWAYDILANTWTAKAFVPVPKALKGGTSIAYLDGKVYLLAGGQKKTDLVNFYGYDVATDVWTPSGLLTLGPNIKIWKDGACLTVLDGTLYALKSNDKYNPFFSYNVLTNTWTEFDSIPMVDSLAGKLKKVAVKDGGAICAGGGAIYAIKGGGTIYFWKYTTLGGWTRSDSIPRLHKKSVAKTGAALAFANNRVYLMKGNNSPEFWCYTRSVLNATRPTPTTVVSTMVEKTNLTNVFSFNVAPNPFNRTTIIRYTVPVAGKVSVKLYNTSGRVIETVNNSYLNQGNYTTTLNASTLASGVYFLRYEDQSNRAEIKLIVE